MAKTRVYIALTGNVIKAIKMLQKYYNMALYVIDVSISKNMYSKHEIQKRRNSVLIVDNLVS